MYNPGFNDKSNNNNNNNNNNDNDNNKTRKYWVDGVSIKLLVWRHLTQPSVIMSEFMSSNEIETNI